MAQKPHKPTDDFRKQVETASGLGLPHDQICCLIGISDETLRKYYDTELGIGKARAQKHEVTGEDGGPQEHTFRWLDK